MLKNGQIYTLDIHLSPEGKLIDDVIKEFETLMNITGKHEFKKFKLWKKAIPQYNIGYVEHENYFKEFEQKHPGIILGGNYIGGISVGDCIKNSEVLFRKAKVSDSSF